MPNAALIANRRGPRRIDQGNYEQAIGYSYHLDASLFAEYLRESVVDQVAIDQPRYSGLATALRSSPPPES